MCHKINVFYFYKKHLCCATVCFGFGSWVLYQTVGDYYPVVMYFDSIVVIWKLAFSGPIFLVCLFNDMFKNLCKSCIKMTDISYCQHKPQSSRLMINSIRVSATICFKALSCFSNAGIVVNHSVSCLEFVWGSHLSNCSLLDSKNIYQMLSDKIPPYSVKYWEMSKEKKYLRKTKITGERSNNTFLHSLLNFVFDVLFCLFIILDR